MNLLMDPCSFIKAEQHDVNFLKDIYSPQLSDDIDFKTREHCNNLQKQNSLKARFVAKPYSQHISGHIKETFSATPSSTSLRTLLLHAVPRATKSHHVTSHQLFSTLP